MIGRLLLARRAISRATGKVLGPILFVVALCLLRAVTAMGMLLDKIFFPSIGRADIRRPIVIVGNPRSGSTLVHRFLVEHRVGHGLEVWRMIHASLTQQTVLQPLLPLLKKVDPTRYHAKAAHETSLTHVDVDDVALTLRFLDGFFLYGFFLAFDDQDWRDLVDPAKRDTSGRDLDWLSALWRRSLTWYKDPGGRVVAKLFSFGPRLPALLARFPEARVIWLVRDPVANIPSAMSLVTGVLDGVLGFWSLPEPTRKRYLDRLYRGLVDLTRRVRDDWDAGRIDRSRVLEVPYDRLMTDFSGVLGEILAFVGHEPDEELKAAIAAQDSKQRSYKSGHKYDLEKYGLTAEQIRRDCGV